MDNDQQFYHVHKDNGEYEFYLVSHQEKRWCIIPKEYHPLCMRIYGCNLRAVGTTAEERFKNYELRTFESYSDFDE